jgi:hypothetical protein
LKLLTVLNSILLSCFALSGCIKNDDLATIKIDKSILFSQANANDLVPRADGAGYQVSNTWLPLKENSLEVIANSPLDLSSLFPSQKIAGKISISADGVFKNDAGRIKFLCASASFTPPYGGYPRHDEAIQYAQQYRRAGYNLVRLHFTDAILMTGRDKDFDYNPDQLDRLHFFLSELRKQGIYWYIDGMTSWNGAKGNVQPDRWAGQYQFKRAVHYDVNARQHWLDLVKSLYGRINPYTGKSILADEALAGIVLVNEGGLHFSSQVFSSGSLKNMQQEMIFLPSGGSHLVRLIVAL